MSDLETKTVLQLIEDHEKLDAWLSGESKRFGDFCKPHADQLKAIKGELLRRQQEQGVDSFKTDAGTAYQSKHTTPKVENPDIFLDFCMENWDGFGRELLQLRAPKVDPFRQYMKEHNGSLPPGTSVSHFITLNIKKD